MLVLTRRLGERATFVIPEGTEIPAGGMSLSVTLVKMRNGSVRIGFDAPKQVAILRAEVQAANTEQEGR